MAASGLFKVIELWSAPGADGDDAYDPSSLAILRLSQIEDQDAIAIGSYNGLLKLLLPGKGQFYSSQVLFEAQLDQAILGLHPGPFNITSAGSVSPPTLAVLHPRAIAFYEVKVSADPGEDAIRTATVRLVHNYPFEESAANVAFGRFQGVRSACDGVCVQSMGGDLMFWEQDAFSFKTQLPDALLPGPLCFASSNDTIVTCTTSGTVEAYKYIALAAQSDTTKAKAVWTLNIAEHALDIQFAPTTPATIVVLGARSVFWLTDSGGLRLSKRLESDPMCMLCYRVDGASMNMLVGTIDRQLIVLRDTQVVWSALLDFIPVAVSLCEFGGTRGVIVALEDTGRVGCFYLGTDPEVATRIVPDAQDVAYERMDEEMAELQGQIRAVLLAETKAPTAAVLELECSHPEIQTREDGSWALASKVRLACTDGDRIDGVSFQVTVASPLVAIPLQTVFNVAGAAGTSVPVTVTCPGGMMWTCHSTMVYLLATYTVNGEPRSASDSFQVPLSLLCTPVEQDDDDSSVAELCPVQLKVIGGGKPLPPLSAIATGLLGATPQSGNRVSVTIPDGSEAHLSQVGDGFTISADTLAAAWLLLDGVVLVAEEQLGQDGNAVVVDEDLDGPLELFFTDLDTHFDLRHEVEHYVKHLDTQAQQIRVVQKRLLARFKDKTPAPLDHLNQLLEASYDALLELTTVLEDAEARLRIASDTLAASTRTILLLIRLRFRLDPAQAMLLVSAMDAETVHASEDGWEERTDAALVHLLKTCLSDTETDAQRVTQFTLPSAEVGTAPLKKHVMQVCAKLGAGATLGLV